MEVQSPAVCLSAARAHQWISKTVICLILQSELSSGWHKWWAVRYSTVIYQVIETAECVGKAGKGGVQRWLFILFYDPFNPFASMPASSFQNVYNCQIQLVIQTSLCNMLDTLLTITAQKPDYKTTNQENKLSIRKFM